MLLNLIKNTPWSSMKDYISPTFFKVVPLHSLTKEGLTIAKNVQSENKDHLVKNLKNILKKLAIEFDHLTDQEELTSLKKEFLASRILSLYFLQILKGENILLDIRLATFSVKNKKVIWHPQNLSIKWDKDFSESLKNIYLGYYYGKEELFEKSLKELNLLACKDLFIKHFGFGNQAKVEFKQEVFFDTFHEIFISCKKNHIKLHHNFISLGLFLALLYESLEKLAVNLNVRAIFFEVDQLLNSSSL